MCLMLCLKLLDDVVDAIVGDVPMTRGGEVGYFVLSHSLLSVLFIGSRC